MTQKLLSNQRGVSLIAVVAAIGLMSLIGLGSTQLLSSTIKQQTRLNNSMTLRMISLNHQRLLQSNVVRLATFSSPPFAGTPLECIANDSCTPAEVAPVTTPPTPDTPVPNIVLAAGNTPLWDGLAQPQIGFGTDGTEVCNEFVHPDDGDGQADCPYSVRTSVRVECPTGAGCLPRFTIEAIYNPSGSSQQQRSVSQFF